MESTVDTILPELNRDIALLLAIWVAIHGGDPAPVEPGPATSLTAGALVAQLRSQVKPLADPLSDRQLAEQLRRLNLDVTFGGGFVCVRGPDGAPGCCVRLTAIHWPVTPD